MTTPHWTAWAMRLALGIPVAATLLFAAGRTGTAALGRWRAWAVTAFLIALAVPWGWQGAGPRWIPELPDAPASSTRWMLAVWASGAVAVTFRHARIAHRLGAWRNAAESPDASWTRTALGLPSPARTAARWRFRFVPGLATPAVLGGRRPVLFLPCGAESWNATARRHVLLHEAEHVRHRDHRLLALWTLLDVACWWHPAWWATRRLMAFELERAVDHAVVCQAPHERGDYARLLVGLASGEAAPGLPGLAAGALERRVAGILRDAVRPPDAAAWSVFAASLLVLGLLGSVLVRTATTPDPLASEARLRLSADPFPGR